MTAVPAQAMRAPRTTRTPVEVPRQVLRHRRERHIAPRPHNVAPAERFASVMAGGALAAWALKSLRTRTTLGVMAGLVASELLWRGATGRCPLYSTLGVSTAGAERETLYEEVERSITVHRPPEEVWKKLREPETLALVMAHFADVQPSGTNRARWLVPAPFGRRLEWETSVVEAKEHELLRWESLPGARIPQAGLVLLRRAPRDLGTEVTIRLRYGGPGGLIGALGARALALAPSVVVGKAARRLKSLIETGEIPSIEHNPSAREASCC